MPVQMTETPQLRVVNGIGFTPDDEANAKEHFGMTGSRGRIKGTDLFAWYNAGAPTYEGISAKSGQNANDSEVVATLEWRKIGKNGVLGKAYETPIERGLVRENREKTTGKFAASDYFAAAMTLVDETMSPVSITLTGDGKVIGIRQDSEGNFIAEHSPTATIAKKDELIAILEERVASLTEKYDALAAKLAEATGEDAEQLELAEV